MSDFRIGCFFKLPAEYSIIENKESKTCPNGCSESHCGESYCGFCGSKVEIVITPEKVDCDIHEMLVKCGVRKDLYYHNGNSLVFGVRTYEFVNGKYLENPFSVLYDAKCDFDLGIHKIDYLTAIPLEHIDKDDIVAKFKDKFKSQIEKIEAFLQCSIKVEFGIFTVD